jgi:prostaglandin-endoperoxide synthase 2
MALILSLFRRFPWLIAWIERHEPIHRFVNRLIVERNAAHGNPRPRPFSLRLPYTSWSALRDRTYTGRQLGEDKADRNLPNAATVSKLFERRGDGIDSKDTSLLFANFAQWFTDSFIRTQPDEKAGAWKQNSSNHEIDLCQIYGLHDKATGALRAMSGGRLKCQTGPDGEVYPPRLLAEGSTADKPIFAAPEFADIHDEARLKRALANVPQDRLAGLFATGLEQGNATPGNIVLNTIFLRAHNHVAGIISGANPDWDDDRIFETSRNVMIVLLLQIVLRDYISQLASVDFPFRLDPEVGEKKGWKRSNWISIEFGLLYRWHALVPNSLVLGASPIPVGETLWNPELVTKTGIGPLVSAASRQPAGRIGLENTPDFFTQPREMLEDGRPVRMSIQEKTIRMARRARMQPYNAYRKAFGLDPVRSFRELTRDDALAGRLSDLYRSVDDLDWYVGLFAEAHDEKEMVGSLLLRMVAFDAFTHIFGNPLASKGVFVTETFSQAGMDLIGTTRSFRQIVDWVVTDPGSVNVSFNYTR